ncbi:hypothetical protein QAD02_008088 [Eretmocerus hayati]|uniref:Uncharacterized protein n=1 Tax=Eretmocerus hayati TaxID=131215 RepID=A0ACC2N5S5_9HYME|nr:hypothetical protein QAD02_008088 [Eretmocerus hayati]
METKAFSSIFPRSLGYKIISKGFVSDGDSKNFNAISETNPYAEYGISVENVLCANHLKRNVSAGIKEISRTRGKIGSIKKIIEHSSKTFHATITKPVSNINNLQIDMAEKCKELRADLEKMPYHIYGDHTHCQDNNFDCNGQLLDGENDLVPELQQKHLFERIQGVMLRAINNVHNLLLNLTTSQCESFNNIVAKTIGAKRLHLSLKLSYKAHCHIAVLLFNTSASIQPICEEMGKDVPHIGQNVQLKRAERNQHRGARLSKQGDVDNRSPRQHQGADENYGRVIEPDISEEQFAIRRAEHYEKLASWQRDAKNLERRTLLQSLSPEWKSKRKWLITASVMGRIWRKLPHNSCSSIVRHIVYRPEINNEEARERLDWGIKFEVVVK